MERKRSARDWTGASVAAESDALRSCTGVYRLTRPREFSRRTLPCPDFWGSLYIVRRATASPDCIFGRLILKFRRKKLPGDNVWSIHTITEPLAKNRFRNSDARLTAAWGFLVQTAKQLLISG